MKNLVPSRGYIHAKLVEKEQKGKLSMPDVPDSLKEPKRFDIVVTKVNPKDEKEDFMEFKVGNKVYLQPNHRAVELEFPEEKVLVISIGDIFTYEA